MIIKRIILAVVVATLIVLLCFLIGGLLVILAGLIGPFGPILAFLGGFLIKWAIVIGICFGILALISGRTSLGFWPWV